MVDLLYSPFDIAYVINSYEMGAKQAAQFVKWLWIEEGCFLHPHYRYDKHKFVLSVYHWSDYLNDKVTIDAEFPLIEKDLDKFGGLKNEELLFSEYFDVDLFFKILRMKILYFNKNRYSKMKLRSLLNAYGYKRRSSAFLQYIHDCLIFYHICTYLKGGNECNICDVNLDEIIVFRVI